MPIHLTYFLYHTRLYKYKIMTPPMNKMITFANNILYLISDYMYLYKVGINLINTFFQYNEV